jgi:general transcription factor 3C polypeptide 5 (transcription factor C subunit 1)
VVVVNEETFPLLAYTSVMQSLERTLPQLSFYSVEYPGYVQPSSVPLAISNLGGQSKVDHAFKRTASKTQTLLELSLRPGNPFAHPIPGDVVGTNNLLLKVIKRKRKHVGDDYPCTIGEYTAEVVGTVSKTARFRSDFMFFPCL